MMNRLNKITRKAKRFIFRKPIFPAFISQYLLIQQAADFYNLSQEDVQTRYHEYRQFHIEQQYELRFGERKTLCFEEAFLLYLSVLQMRPKHVVEIGTQYGKSTRRIIDILHFAGHENCKMTCFDITDQVKYFSQDEANLELYDVTNNFKDHVLIRLKPDLIYLDARPYWLLFNVISEFLEWSKIHLSILTIHDCSPLLYNPRSQIKKEEAKKITSQTGVWERHVLSELFQTPNNTLDDFNSPTHRLRIFNTPHGLSIISPKKEKL